MNYLTRDTAELYCPICNGDEPSHEQCEKCDGCGYVECNYGHEHDCPYCSKGKRNSTGIRPTHRPQLCDECLSLGSITFAREWVRELFLEGLTTHEQRAILRVGVAPVQMQLGEFVIQTHEPIPQEIAVKWRRGFHVFGWVCSIAHGAREEIKTMQQLRELRAVVDAWRNDKRNEWLRGAA